MFSKSPAFEKCIIRKNKQSQDSFIENLEDLNEKSGENIKKVLENRVETKEYFTNAGTSLVCIEGGPGKSNLLKKFVENVYEKLKNTHKVQVVALSGSGLRAKEGCKSDVLTHFGFLSRSCEGFVKAVHCAYELVGIFASDGSNSYFGECVEVRFDSEFRICGCWVKAKLTDLDFSENCGIFRILLSLAEPSLQHLGVMHRARVDKNIELHQQFKACLDQLGISWSETLDIMELLSVSLLAEDLTYTTSSYTIAGQKAINKYILSTSRHLSKISKILSIIPERLSDFFTSLSRQQCADKLKSFRKLMIFLAFESFLDKINNALKKKSQEYRLDKAKYTVNILSFPLAKHKKNIDGFISNLIVECFEFVNYEQYFSVLSTFNEEKIQARLSVPRCRYIVELFLDKSFGLVANFSNQRFWNNLQRELGGDSVYNKVVGVEKDVLTVNYSWGSNSYELGYLQQQFLVFPDSTFADLLKRCSNRQISSSLNNFFNFTYPSYINFVLSELLSSSSSNSTFSIFCYKDPNDLLYETSLPSILSIPYKFMIKKKLVNLDHLKKNGCSPQISETFYYFDKSQQEPLKRIFTGKIPAFEVSGLKVASDSPFKGPKLDEYIELVIKPVKTITRSSSAKLRVYSVSSSKTSTKLLHGSFQNFKNYSFVDYLPQIIRIQSVWRGHRSRKYFRALQTLHNAAKRIQKHWRGFTQRKKLNLKTLLSSIILIQRHYKLRYFTRNRAAKLIQKFFLNKFYVFSHSNHSKLSLHNKFSSTALRTTQRSLIRAQKTQRLENSYKFAPSLSKKTLELAKKAQTDSYKGLKIEDRLMLQGKEMIEKKEVAALNKKRNELRLNPSSSVKTFNNHFYEDNVQFLVDKKTALKDLKIVKAQQEMQNCTFRPNISSAKRPRSALETVNDLYNWNQRRNKLLETKRKLSQDKEQKHERFRVTGKSQEINKVKEKQQQAKLNLMRSVQKSIEPYWPNK